VSVAVRGSNVLSTRRKRPRVAGYRSECLEVRQLLTAPPTSASEFFPALNQSFNDFLASANAATNAVLQDAVAAPTVALNASLADARNQVTQAPALAVVDPSVVASVVSLPMDVGMLFSSFGAVPAADMPGAFGLGAVTSTSDIDGSYWAYGSLGSLNYSTPSQSGSASGFLSVYTPASGDNPASILNASGELSVVYGGSPTLRVDATRSKIFANGDSENWVTQITITNGSPNENNFEQLVNELNVLPTSPVTIRMGTISNYNQLKDTVFQNSVLFSY